MSSHCDQYIEFIIEDILFEFLEWYHIKVPLVGVVIFDDIINQFLKERNDNSNKHQGHSEGLGEES